MFLSVIMKSWRLFKERISPAGFSIKGISISIELKEVIFDG